MARIRMIKVKGRKLSKPKVVYFKRDNLDKYSKKKKGKYDIMEEADEPQKVEKIKRVAKRISDM